LKKTENHIELIEKYFEGKLDKDALSNFEKELETNAAFANEVELYKKAVRGLQDEGLRSQLKEYHNELFSTDDKGKKANWRFYLSIAASLVLLITSIYVFTNRATSYENLFTAYFEPYHNLVTTRSNTTTHFEKALESYSQGNFEKAIQAFDKISEKKQVYNDVLFYKGISYLALDMPTEAILLFKQLKNNKQYNEQLAWYLALSYLKLNDAENARKLLVQIGTKNYKFTQAQELLEQLED